MSHIRNRRNVSGEMSYKITGELEIQSTSSQPRFFFFQQNRYLHEMHWISFAKPTCNSAVAQWKSASVQIEGLPVYKPHPHHSLTVVSLSKTID